jgi:hypothetical protein
MIEADAAAVRDLCAARVPCNKRLAGHPTIQVGGCAKCVDPETCSVGLLGVLNGLCGAYEGGQRSGWGAVAVIFGEDGRPQRAQILENEAEDPGP